ncbi:FadR/GntR family transcriptional regulator [Algiphilus sp.]|uniref:FadR/GntR family transcriptional regulator n=1 Tax=Algiphilus sp. TaxID=1872431 RepID=UPI0032ECF0E5
MSDAESHRSELVAEKIERAIFAYEFRGRLPPERELATRYAVSRATLREALSLLVARGLLTRRQGSGTYINDDSDRRMAEIWSDMADRHPRLQDDLIEFRVMLECHTAQMAAARHDDVDRTRLTSAAEAVDAAYNGSDRHEQIRADVAFHRAIADASHNPVFTYLVASLLKLLHEHVQLSIAGLAPGSYTAQQLRAQHRALAEAILARDIVAARHCAEAHMNFVRVTLNDSARPLPFAGISSGYD